MSEEDTKSDSYMRVIRYGDQYHIRWCVRMDVDEGTILQPLEWRGSVKDVEMAIRAVENGAKTMIETGASTSLMENLPVLDSLSKETLIRQADKLRDGWGIMVFRHTGINAWFALVATDEMFAEKKFGRGNGNEDMAIAIGELNIVRACTAHAYNKEMKHHVIPRDEDGNYINHTPEERARRRPIERSKNRKWKEAFDQWHGSAAWNAKIQEWKGGTPKGGVSESAK